MHFSSTVATAVLTLASSASAVNYLGFNSGATKDDGTAKFKADFAAEFTTAKNLQNAPGDFNAVRLYTNIQAYSENSPIEAFEAAIETKTFMLLGIWASGTNSISREINALKETVQKHGTKFTDLVIGISVGSEDLYRDSITGQKNKAGVGASPQTILKFIKDYKDGVANTPLASKPVGHVDTWDVWPNATIKPVMDAVDFIGVNEFPYYEDGKGNNIKNAGRLFDTAYETVLSVANGKPVWVTETGWPYVGEVWGEAEATVDNAKYYWNEVGCRKLFGKTTAFWYALRDSNPDNKMKFAITNNLSTKARFDLTCPKTFDTPAAVTTSASAGPTGSSSSTASSPASISTTTRGSGASTTPAQASTTSTTPNSASTVAASGLTYGLVAMCLGVFYLM
jgi:glucan endo-1,3-beta-D-glucosidase